MKKKDCPCQKCIVWRIERAQRKEAERIRALWAATMHQAGQHITVQLSGQPVDAKQNLPENPIMIGRQDKKPQQADHSNEQVRFIGSWK